MILLIMSLSFLLLLRVGLPHKAQLRLVILGFVHGCLDNIVSLIGVPCSSYVGINSGTSGRDFLNPMGLPWIPSVVSSNLVTGRSLCCNCRSFEKTNAQIKYDYFSVLVSLWVSITPEKIKRKTSWTILL